MRTESSLEIGATDANQRLLLPNPVPTKTAYNLRAVESSTQTDFKKLKRAMAVGWNGFDQCPLRLSGTLQLAGSAFPCNQAMQVSETRSFAVQLCSDKLLSLLREEIASDTIGQLDRFCIPAGRGPARSWQRSSYILCARHVTF